MNNNENITRREILCSTIRETVLKKLPDISKRDLELFISNIYEMTLLHINNISKENILFYIGCRILITCYDDNINPIENNVKFDLEFWYKTVEKITEELDETLKLKKQEE